MREGSPRVNGDREDQQHAPIKIGIRPFDPANLVEPHRCSHCKLHDPGHWQGEPSVVIEAAGEPV